MTKNIFVIYESIFRIRDEYNDDIYFLYKKMYNYNKYFYYIKRCIIKYLSSCIIKIFVVIIRLLI